jgi:hypothetical protein
MIPTDSSDAAAIIMDNNRAVMLTLIEFIKLQNEALARLRPKFPLAGTPGNPLFELGDNTAHFMKRFEGLLKDYEPDADDERKIELLERNVAYNSHSPITLLEGFETNDWELLRASFLAEFAWYEVDDRSVGATLFIAMLRALRRVGGDDLVSSFLRWLDAFEKIQRVD